MLLQGIAEAAEALPQPPLDWTAIIVQSLITIGIIAAAAVPAYFTLKGKLQRTEENTEVVKSETRNAHNPNQPLRHDIDLLLERTKDIKDIKGDIIGLRQDVRQLYQNDHDLWDTLAKRHEARSRSRGGSS